MDTPLGVLSTRSTSCRRASPSGSSDAGDSTRSIAFVGGVLAHMPVRRGLMSGRPLAALALAMSLGACTGGPHPVTPTTSPPPGCAEAGDLVSAAGPLVHAKPRCGSAFDVSVERKIPDVPRRR